MDYRSQIASYQQHVQKDMDYSQIMVAELESGWSISYQQQESYFVADKWFPQIGVDKIAGYYPKWAKENAFTNKAGTWRPGTLPPTGELKVDTPGFYACQRYAFQLPLLADIPFVADEAYPVEKATTQMVTDVLRLNKELIIANAFFKASVWGCDWTGVNSGETGTGGQVTGLTFRRFNDADSDPPGGLQGRQADHQAVCRHRPQRMHHGRAGLPVPEAQSHAHSHVQESSGS